MVQIRLFATLLILLGTLHAISKPHILTFGKWQTVKWIVGFEEDKELELRIRPLYVDGKLKEFTLGAPHEITDRLFAVRRVFRVNDTLPGEKNQIPRWTWERGNWLLIDRATARIAQVVLPEFDVFYSNAVWYRDYAAYCGVSADGKKVYAVVAQVGRRKPVLRQLLKDVKVGELPDSACPAPEWQKQPVRVTFESDADQKLVFAIRTRSLDIVRNSDDESEDAE